MLAEIRKLSMEQLFLISFLVCAVILSFLFGYVFFRYEQIDICKSAIEIL
jgi:hypothetical protein